MVSLTPYLVFLLMVSIIAECRFRRFRSLVPRKRRYSRRTTQVPVSHTSFDSLSKAMKENHYFLQHFANALNQAIMSMKLDRFHVRDFLSPEVLFCEGYAQNFSTFRNDWRFMNITLLKNKRQKCFHVSFVIRRLMYTYEVFRRRKTEGVYKMGTLTILVPISVFRIKMKLIGLTKGGRYVPTLDAVEYVAPFREEVHYSLIPKDADESTIAFYNRKRVQIEQKARGHFHSSVMPYVRGVLENLFQHLFEGIVGSLPKMRKLSQEIDFSLADYSAGAFYQERANEPHFFKIKKTETTVIGLEPDLETNDSDFDDFYKHYKDFSGDDDFHFTD